MSTKTLVENNGVALWVAHDPLPESGPLPHDIVVGPGGASRTLLTLTPRNKVGRVWDVGCGSGVQSVFAAVHADHVIATDIDPRCLDFTRESAALNSLSIETRLGSFAEPIADETFDLIISNPPFVMGNVTQLTHRESPRPADQLTQELLATLPKHLADGGLMVMVCAWLEKTDTNWEQAIAQWLPSDCNVWVGLRDVQLIADYVDTWMADAGLTDADTRQRWIEQMQAWDATAVAFGWVVVWRPTSPATDTWQRVEDVRNSPQLPTGEQVWQRLFAADLSERLTATKMLTQRFRATTSQAWRGDLGVDGLLLDIRQELDLGSDLATACTNAAATNNFDPDDVLIHGLAGLKMMVDLGLLEAVDTPI